MKKILLLLLFTVASYGQAVFDEGLQIKNNTSDNSATKVNVQSTDGTINTISKSDLVNVVEVNDVPSLPLIGEAGKIYVVKNLNKIYRWNSTFYQELAVTDISGLQAQLDLKANTSEVVKLTGNQTISGQKSFSLTGKIDMQTDNAFPAISVTSLGSNGLAAAAFINDSSSPYSTALRLQTGLSGGVGNRALNVLNASPIGTGIFSNASNGGVSISSESHNGDSYVSNIAYGGTGRNYVGRNNGTETYSVDKTGNVLGNSYIKRSTPANNILLAGGGDLAQGTAFNKNFGLNTGDVVGATTLLNQYGTTPIDWTATAFNSGQVVFYVGKQWIAKMATVAGDVPAASSKWDEITFEALANKTVIVDQTIIDGSTNAVAGNAVFDGLATKAPIVHNHTVSQITDLSKASVGLGNVDNTSDLSKPLSTATQTALNGKEPSFAKNTAFNKNFGTTAGTVVEGNDSRINNGQTAFGWGNHVNGGYAFTTGSNINQASFGTALGLGSNAYTSTAYLPIASPNSLNTWSSTNGFYGLHGSSVGMPSTSSYWSGIRTVLPNDSGYGLEITANIDENELYFRRYAINYKSWQKLWHDGNFNPANYLPLSGGALSGAISGTSATFSSTISASPATTANQVPTWGQVQAIAKPYKVYTALLSQSSTSNPTVVILENTLGTVTFTRSSIGVYSVNSSGLFTADKTFVIMGAGINANYTNAITLINSSTFYIITKVSSTQSDADSANTKVAFEIRVYN